MLAVSFPRNRSINKLLVLAILCIVVDTIVSAQKLTDHLFFWDFRRAVVFQ